MRPPATELAELDGHRIEYRLTGPAPASGSGPHRPLAVVLHGGHMSARCRFGEEVYRAAGFAVLVVSRPGYGRTAADAGPSAPEFAVRVAGLIRRLGFDGPVTAVGISIGARSALTLAAYAPELVDRVILISPVGFGEWPRPRLRRIARIVFRPSTQQFTWAVVHGMLRRNPGQALPRLITSLSTLPGDEAVRRLGADASAAADFLLSCRSAAGFMIDLRPPTDVAAKVHQPVLIVATRADAAVAWDDHPARLAATLPTARVVDSEAPTHLLWLGDRAAEVDMIIRAFLTDPRPA
ncbi:MAG TPA: alpha/beta hydrolase [Microlunatus sp.]|nr:alpha/beta hydrolase [Microlunatus sp.]